VPPAARLGFAPASFLKVQRVFDTESMCHCCCRRVPGEGTLRGAAGPTLRQANPFRVLHDRHSA